MTLAPPTFDWVCAALECPVCSTRAVDPCAIDLQTKVSSAPALRRLRVGDRVELRARMEEGGYLPTHDGGPREPLAVIDAWSCPSCGTSFLWARLTFHRDTLAAVDSVHLTEDDLEAADYVTAEALQLAPVEPREALPRLLELPPAELRRELARLEAERLGQ